MYWNCHTYFSFGYGTLSPADLFDEARRQGVHKLAITDINNTSGYIELLRLCREKKNEWQLDIAVGIEFRNKGQLLYVGLARHAAGFEELNRYLSFHTGTGTPLRPKAPPFGHAYVIYPLTNAQARLRENEWIGIRHTELSQLVTQPRQRRSKMMAWLPVTFRDKMGFNIHRLVRAIDQNTLLSKLDPASQAHPTEIMQPEYRVREKFAEFPDLIHSAENMLLDCHAPVELGTDKNKKYFTGSKYEDRELLTSLAMEGCVRRYGPGSDEYIMQRFEKELEIIERKNFEAYYLIAHDIVQYADRQGFAHVGRGSGANSLIAYCLGITDVDPLELDLYFERFLNSERTSPPDFDIDFSWKDRDQVIRYIFDRFKKEHVSLLGTHVTYQGRSTLRELGKVFGLPKEEIDRIVAYPDPDRYSDNISRMIFRYASRMKEIPAHLSIHAGGVLITESPIYAYTATDLPPKGFPVAHFEMHNAEDVGIFKLDILSQRGLGHIKDTVALVQKNTGHTIDISRFHAFKQDEKIKQLLRTGNCMGCFYVESPAMRMLLGKLQCEDYLTLVAASSIIRPGVARSGMMRAYIERHHAVRQGLRYHSVHPRMDEIMKETYGVMVYQEDVIKVAHLFAGLSLTEADVLRRGMSGKYRSRKEFQVVRDKFFSNCEELGYTPEVTQRVWYEIESFAGYSFAKGHSASFAVESYQSLYLKAHFPVEFMVGVINNFGGFYRTEFYLHEARRWGATIHAPCINTSELLTSLTEKQVYLGWIHVKSLEQKLIEQIVANRRQQGPFRSLDQFMRRISISLEQVRLLIRIGAFRFTGKSKKELLWNAQLYFGQVEHPTFGLTELFEDEPLNYQLPNLSHDPLEEAYDEIELLGFPLCDPFQLIDLTPDTCGAACLAQHMDQQVAITGYLITTKDTRTIKGERMHFGTFYDAAGDVFDTVHFPPVAKKYPFRGRGFYRMAARVTEDFGYPLLEVLTMEKYPMRVPPHHHKEITLKDED